MLLGFARLGWDFLVLVVCHFGCVFCLGGLVNCLVFDYSGFRVGFVGLGLGWFLGCLSDK